MLNSEFIKQVGPFNFAYRTGIRQFTKRALGKDLTVRLPNGERYIAAKWDKAGTEVFITNCNLDWGSEELFRSHLDPNGIFIDVGAHTGYYSLYMARNVRRVIAIEPTDACLSVLRKNLADAKFEVIQAFAGATAGKATDSGIRKGFAKMVSSDDGMPVVTIDGLMSERPPAMLTGIKIDVDGPDLEVASGAVETIKRDQPLVLIESKPTPDLFALTDDLGYSVFGFERTPAKAFKFRRFEPGQHPHTKMLFLSPPRLMPSFVALASKHS